MEKYPYIWACNQKNNNRNELHNLVPQYVCQSG